MHIGKLSLLQQKNLNKRTNLLHTTIVDKNATKHFYCTIFMDTCIFSYVSVLAKTIIYISMNESYSYV